MLIDVINNMDFQGSDRLVKQAIPAARAIARLKEYCRGKKIPAIYVNDNFGVWRSDFASVLKFCLSEKSKGRNVAKLLVPQADDYFVLKPKHSAFYSTTLEILLDYLKCRKLIIVGFAGNICVLFTANDAYMRDFEIIVPGDCIASNTKQENDHALTLMETILKADVRDSDELIRSHAFRKTAARKSSRGPARRST